MKRQNFCECGGRLYMVHGVLRCGRCVNGWPWRKTCRVCTNQAVTEDLCLECEQMRSRVPGRTR